MHYNPFSPIDFLDHLTEGEIERFFSFSSLNRRQEFVASRILRHTIFGTEHIHYDEMGAPYIKGEGFISISHTKGVVGIAFSPQFKVGLDLERITDKASRVCDKFLSDDEGQLFNRLDAVEMTKVWSCKEALYKLAGRKGFIFKEHLLLKKGGDALYLGQIIHPKEVINVEINTFADGDLIISVNDKACNYVKNIS